MKRMTIAEAIRHARELEAELVRVEQQADSIRRSIAETRARFQNRKTDSLISRMLEEVERRPGIDSASLAEAVETDISNVQELMSRYSALGLAERRRTEGNKAGWWPRRSA
jgi:hypothetical protein